VNPDNQSDQLSTGFEKLRTCARDPGIDPETALLPMLQFNWKRLSRSALRHGNSVLLRPGLLTVQTSGRLHYGRRSQTDIVLAVAWTGWYPLRQHPATGRADSVPADLSLSQEKDHHDHDEDGREEDKQSSSIHIRGKCF
jgi:hypothetical protein